MIFLKTEDEIELMRAANLLVADTLTEYPPWGNNKTVGCLGRGVH